MRGTGKSTLVKFIIKALESYGINSEEDVVYTSFTGKATQVLQKKGNKNVSTLHKLLYDFFPNSDGTFFKKPKDIIPYKIVIVDECSMVPKELLQLLFKHDIYIICLGDPGQLPPISKEDDNLLLDNPHIFLDEIMRQAAESEIIQLSMKIRNNETIPFFKGKEVQVLKKSELTSGMLLWADQILCATNNTRISLNNQIRELLGKSGDPQEGDKIICLRNYWDELSLNGDAPLINGTIGYLKNPFETFVKIPQYITKGRIDKINILQSDFISDSKEYFSSLTMDKKLILEGQNSLNWEETFKMSKNWKTKDLIPKEFTYGYAITGHKSQGSEWDKVLVIEENFPFDKEEHKRWLYTCVTRSSSRLVLIRS